jgi:pyridoxamine 5'-phosphate oxidase
MTEDDAARMRRDYSQRPLDERAVAGEPIRQIEAWFAEARGSGLLEPNAMALATASLDGRPSVRIVLLKGIDAQGLTFFTNLDSRKAQELAANPRAALCFWWDRLERQLRIEGRVEKVAAEEADAYFASRPHGSRIGAWASPQSRVIASRAVLEADVAREEGRFEGQDVPRPPVWGGYRIVPELVELWQGRSDRLHDRLVYRRGADGWTLERLAP